MTETSEAKIYQGWMLVLWYVVFTLICTGIAYVIGPVDWGVAKTLFAGVLGGAISFFCVFANHVLLL